MLNCRIYNDEQKKCNINVNHRKHLKGQVLKVYLQPQPQHLRTRTLLRTCLYTPAHGLNVSDDSNNFALLSHINIISPIICSKTAHCQEKVLNYKM